MSDLEMTLAQNVGFIPYALMGSSATLDKMSRGGTSQ